MFITSWNISWASSKEKICRYLQEELHGNDTIVCLQEVTPSVYEFLKDNLGNGFQYAYSLEHRTPGPYDSKSRKLGVLIICPKEITISFKGVLERVPYPDRTMCVRCMYGKHVFTIVSLHSVTGCNYHKGKSVQFDAFAEAIDAIKPDVVTFDANEPDIDHYDIGQMVFFNNGDKGSGARNFFHILQKNGLDDAYAKFYDKSKYKLGEPLTVSHIINGQIRKRYDFIFIRSDKMQLEHCRYDYQGAINSTSDHAAICLTLGIKNDKKINNTPFDQCKQKVLISEDELLKYCRYYKTDKEEKNKLFADYERIWIQHMLTMQEYHFDLVREYIASNLETFNIDDGVPLSLKALLFNRYCHWEYIPTAEGFMEFYKTKYLKEIE